VGDSIKRKERDILQSTHISLWEHSSHCKLIGRGVSCVSGVSQLVYHFFCLASPRGKISRSPYGRPGGSIKDCILALALSGSVSCCS